MHKIKVALNKFWVRLYAAGRILFKRKESFVVLRIDETNMMRMIAEDLYSERPDFSKVDIDFSFHGLQIYNVHKMIQILNDQIDPTEMVVMKAEYQIGAEEWAEKNLHDGKKATP